MGIPVSRPTGYSIFIYADVNGTNYYLRNLGQQATGPYSLGTGLVEATRDIAGAARFILEDNTKYLYLQDAGGYYPIALVDTNTVAYSTIELRDLSVYRDPGFPETSVPLTCVLPAAGAITCAATPPGSSPTNIDKFGICNGYFVVFRTCDDFVAGCPSAAGVCAPVPTLRFLLADSSPSSIIPPPGGAEPSTSPAPPPPFQSSHSSPGETGSCSVSVMLYLASSTTYVPYGYEPPESPPGIGLSTSHGLGGLGGDGGFGEYGCTPITRTVGFVDEPEPSASSGISAE